MFTSSLIFVALTATNNTKSNKRDFEEKCCIDLTFENLSPQTFLGMDFV